MSNKKLMTLSVSGMKTFQTCPRKYMYTYRDRREATGKSDALRFGSAIDLGWRVWWEGIGTVGGGSLMHRVINAIRESADLDPFELVKAEEGMVGYHVRWHAETIAKWRFISNEAKFRAQMINPRSGRPSRIRQIGGYRDTMIREAGTGRLWIREGKTAGRDIEPGSDFWTQKRMDPQASMYYDGTTAEGTKPEGLMYDVMRRCALKPKKATPVELRTYRQPKDRAKEPKYNTKAWTAWTALEPHEQVDETQWADDDPRLLYKGQRSTDESPEEFRLRVRAAIKADPNAYYQRQTVERTERDQFQHRANVWNTAQQIRANELADAKLPPGKPELRDINWTQNSLSCHNFNRLCEYHPVCSGESMLADESRYQDRVISGRRDQQEATAEA